MYLKQSLACRVQHHIRNRNPTPVTLTSLTLTDPLRQIHDHVKTIIYPIISDNTRSKVYWGKSLNLAYEVVILEMVRSNTGLWTND